MHDPVQPRPVNASHLTNACRGADGTVRLSRRSVLAGSGAGVAAVVTGAGQPTASAQDEFAILRVRYREILIGPPDLDTGDPDIAAAIEEINEPIGDYIDLVDTAPGRNGVFTDIPLQDPGGDGDISDPTRDTMDRLQDMAYAYAIPGGTYAGDEELESILVEGMRMVHGEAFHVDGVHNGDKWFNWEIALPGRIGRVLTVLYDQIPAGLRDDLLAAITYYVPDPGFNYPPDDDRYGEATGANLLDLCYYVVAQGILGENPDRIALAIERAVEGFNYGHYDPATDEVDADHRDGPYTDGSYIQHDVVAYTGSYGIVMLSKTSQILSLLDGSSWEITDPRAENMLDAVDKVYLPWFFDSAMMSPVRGRAVARDIASDHDIGRSALPHILRLAGGVDQETATRWRGRVRGMLERDQTAPATDTSNIASLLLIKQLLDSDVDPLPEPVEHVIFPKMDRAVLRRPGWAVALALSSQRIARFEVMSNGENKRGWHQGSGALYLYLDGDPDGHYTNAYWPTVDPYRLAGTTVDSRELPDQTGGSVTGTMIGYGKLTGGSMVGGSFDGDAYRGARNAAIVHHERGYIHPDEGDDPPPPMYARMSWFAVDNGVVCLGSGITGGSGAPVETIIEDRRVVVDGNPWYVNGTEIGESGEPGWSETLTDVQSLTLPGTAGYVFLDESRTVNAKRENRTGSWSDIRAGGDDTEITRGYQTAWLDHGPTPEDASYAWLLAPNADVERTRELADDPGVEVVANTTVAQAIRAPSTGYFGVNFYGSGSVTHGHTTLTADRMCSISALFALPESGDRTEIAIADPTQLDSQVTVSAELPPGRPWEVDDSDDTVTATLEGDILTIEADVSDHDGLVRRVFLRG